jgi:hypothetical protein
MSDIIILRNELIELNNKQNKINDRINFINNQIKLMAEEYIKTNHLNVTTPIEYIYLYSIVDIEMHIKDMYGVNVIWGNTSTDNLVYNPHLIFDLTTPVLLPIMKFVNIGIQYISPDMYKYKLITFLKNKDLEYNLKFPTIYCKYCKEPGHKIKECQKLICYYCHEYGHSTRNCEIKPCIHCNECGHEKFKICPDTGVTIITCPNYKKLILPNSSNSMSL